MQEEAAVQLEEEEDEMCLALVLLQVKAADFLLACYNPLTMTSEEASL